VWSNSEAVVGDGENNTLAESWIGAVFGGVWVEGWCWTCHGGVGSVSGSSLRDGTSSTIFIAEDTRELITREKVAACDRDDGTLVATLRGGAARAAACAITSGGKAEDLSSGGYTALEFDGEDTLGIDFPFAIGLVPGKGGTKLRARGLRILSTGSIYGACSILDTTIAMSDTRVPDDRLRDIWVTDNGNVDEISGMLLDWDRGLELESDIAVNTSHDLLVVWSERHGQVAKRRVTTWTSSVGIRLRTKAVTIGGGLDKSTGTTVTTATVEGGVRVTDRSEGTGFGESTVHIGITDRWTNTACESRTDIFAVLGILRDPDRHVGLADAILKLILEFESGVSDGSGLGGAKLLSEHGARSGSAREVDGAASLILSWVSTNDKVILWDRRCELVLGAATITGVSLEAELEPSRESRGGVVTEGGIGIGLPFNIGGARNKRHLHIVWGARKHVWGLGEEDVVAVVGTNWHNLGDKHHLLGDADTARSTEGTRADADLQLSLSIGSLLEVELKVAQWPSLSVTGDSNLGTEWISGGVEQDTASRGGAIIVQGGRRTSRVGVVASSILEEHIVTSGVITGFCETYSVRVDGGGSAGSVGERDLGCVCVRQVARLVALIRVETLLTSRPVWVTSVANLTRSVRCALATSTST